MTKRTNNEKLFEQVEGNQFRLTEKNKRFNIQAEMVSLLQGRTITKVKATPGDGPFPLALELFLDNGKRIWIEAGVRGLHGGDTISVSDYSKSK